MNSKMFTIIVLVISLCTALLPVSADSIEPFTFAHITDLHILSEKAVKDYKAVLNHLEDMDTDISFYLNTGDLTSYGYPEEFNSYLEATRAVVDENKVHACSGNHDTRWSNTGKQNFRKLIGKSTYSFDHNGVHFVILDSSMLIEQYGHFEPEHLDWLENDLEQLPTNTPVVIAVHHPLFLEKLFVDNEYEFLETIAPFNVVLVLSGHTHRQDFWTINGVNFCTADATLNRQGFNLVDVTPDKITLHKGFATTTTLSHIASFSLKNKPSPTIKVKPINEKSRYTVVATAPEFENAEMMLDCDRTFMPLEHIDKKYFAGQIPYRELPPGTHRVVIKMTSDTHGEWRVMKKFTLMPDDRDEKVLFSFQTGGAIQSSPVAVEDTIIFGSNDGNVYCIDAANGDLEWKYKTAAEIIATPAIRNDRVYIGSLDGTFVSLDVGDGDTAWKYNTGSPILATARVTEERVFFGTGDFTMHALECDSGTPLWTFETGRLIKMQPAYKDGKLYFGSWDGYFYCLDAAKGSEVWKKQISERMLFAPATSSPNIVGDNVIFVSHNYVTHCLDTKTGKELWSYPNTDTTRPSYNNGIVYGDSVIYGSITGHVDSFSVEDGSLNFATPVTFKSHQDPIFDSSPALFNDTAYVGSVGGYLYGVNAQSGELDWRFALQDGYIFSSPLIHKNILYIGTNGGKLYALKLTSLSR